MRRLEAFIAERLRRSVHCRSPHPGNIVFDGNRCGLIDVLHRYRRALPLSRWARRRNGRHVLRSADDRPYLAPERIEASGHGYRGAANLPAGAVRVALQCLHAPEPGS